MVLTLATGICTSVVLRQRFPSPTWHEGEFSPSSNKIINHTTIRANLTTHTATPGDTDAGNATTSFTMSSDQFRSLLYYNLSCPYELVQIFLYPSRTNRTGRRQSRISGATATSVSGFVLDATTTTITTLFASTQQATDIDGSFLHATSLCEFGMFTTFVW